MNNEHEKQEWGYSKQEEKYNQMTEVSHNILIIALHMNY